MHFCSLQHRSVHIRVLYADHRRSADSSFGGHQRVSRSNSRHGSLTCRRTTTCIFGRRFRSLLQLLRNMYNSVQINGVFPVDDPRNDLPLLCTPCHMQAYRMQAGNQECSVDSCRYMLREKWFDIRGTFQLGLFRLRCIKMHFTPCLLALLSLQCMTELTAADSASPLNPSMRLPHATCIVTTMPAITMYHIAR